MGRFLSNYISQNFLISWEWTKFASICQWCNYTSSYFSPTKWPSKVNDPSTLSWSHPFGSKAFENFRPISNQVSIGDYRQPICSSSQMLRFLSSLWSEPLQNQLVASRIKNRDSEVMLLITGEFLTTQMYFQL